MITNQIVPKMLSPELGPKATDESADDVESIDELLASLGEQLAEKQTDENVSQELGPSQLVDINSKSNELEKVIAELKPEEIVEMPKVSMKANMINPGPVNAKSLTPEGVSLPNVPVEDTSTNNAVNTQKTTLGAFDPGKISNISQAVAKESEQTENGEIKKILNELNGEMKAVDADHDSQISNTKPNVKNMSGADFLSARKEVHSDMRGVSDSVVDDSKETLDKLDQLLPKENGQFKAQHQLGIRTLDPAPRVESLSGQFPKAEVDGHVTQGAMATDRFSTEALTNITSQIKTFAGRGGGEITIRLKPENLGELHVRVNTVGDNVGLQIKASDQDAKTILQDSLKYLQDSLSKQNMSLGRVNISVAGESTAMNSSSSDLNGFDGKGQSDLANFSQGNSQGDYGNSEFRNLWDSEQTSSYESGRGLPGRAEGVHASALNHGYGKVQNSTHNLDLRA